MLRHYITVVGVLIAGPIIREALEHRDVKIGIKEAAYLMNIDEALFRRQLSGEGHISLLRLEKLPLKFWRVFPTLLALKYGTSRRMRQEAAYLRFLGQHRRMAKMHLAVQKEEKAS
jgi:hypothetical protein